MNDYKSLLLAAAAEYGQARAAQIVATVKMRERGILTDAEAEARLHRLTGTGSPVFTVRDDKSEPEPESLLRTEEDDERALLVREIREKAIQRGWVTRERADELAHLRGPSVEEVL